jgi:hypothetical protein
MLLDGIFQSTGIRSSDKVNLLPTLDENKGWHG